MSRPLVALAVGVAGAACAIAVRVTYLLLDGPATLALLAAVAALLAGLAWWCRQGKVPAKRWAASAAIPMAILLVYLSGSPWGHETEQVLRALPLPDAELLASDHTGSYRLCFDQCPTAYAWYTLPLGSARSHVEAQTGALEAAGWRHVLTSPNCDDDRCMAFYERTLAGHLLHLTLETGSTTAPLLIDGHYQPWPEDRTPMRLILA